MALQVSNLDNHGEINGVLGYEFFSRGVLEVRISDMGLKPRVFVYDPRIPIDFEVNESFREPMVYTPLRFVGCEIGLVSLTGCAIGSVSLTGCGIGAVTCRISGPICVPM